MHDFGIFLILAIGFLFSMFAKRITRAYLTAPIAFLAIGLAFSESGIIERHVAREALHLVAEITLVILLFLDAAQIDLKQLRRLQTWPLRMLLAGLPLAILIGTFANWALFPEWPLMMCALVAALLAPTDAALGQAVVTNPEVPERVRNAITVESGLNDGLALPIILLFASFVAGMGERDGTGWVIFGVQQVAFGALAGLAVGLAGAFLLLFCKERRLTSETYEGVGAIALAGTAYALATVVGGNGFISAFVAGLAFGSQVKGQCSSFMSSSKATASSSSGLPSSSSASL
jgi:NhaP-type Na+/H+ and K+/H+ antiporters